MATRRKYTSAYYLSRDTVSKVVVKQFVSQLEVANQRFQLLPKYAFFSVVLKWNENFTACCVFCSINNLSDSLKIQFQQMYFFLHILLLSHYFSFLSTGTYLTDFVLLNLHSGAKQVVN